MTDESHGITLRKSLLGAMIAGGLTIPLYQLTMAIIGRYAEQPLPDGNQAAATIAVAVRTLVMGLSVLMTAVFAFIAFGLLLLAVQTGVKWITNQN
ncbi:DUF3082 domain-containing protein [Euhalothece natronophila Z-M001]|uniref:DUF3082 domain-containing protein n=1 Tax=Euhalothece natronophila Z-M001 TaxID=522448 RepID=A0A5B8NJN0_9CHRO|nr:DUF3082 domain-containing protein [Euhalothece natronophila]QDZ38575.1 DUF3082 domain-containing protein [Euhalothece natronophila Z-M001]